MNMENPMGANDIDPVLRAFMDTHPDYKDKNFTNAELKDALAFAQSSPATDSEDEVLKRALDARVAARAVAGKTPVTTDMGEVIGMAGSEAEANAMYMKDKASRDNSQSGLQQ